MYEFVLRIKAVAPRYVSWAEAFKKISAAFQTIGPSLLIQEVKDISEVGQSQLDEIGDYVADKLVQNMMEGKYVISGSVRQTVKYAIEAYLQGIGRP